MSFKAGRKIENARVPATPYGGAIGEGGLPTAIEEASSPRSTSSSDREAAFDDVMVRGRAILKKRRVVLQKLAE